ncbi:MAG: cyclic dehypoxanthinyl futalosine synthase, partial [Kiritimatiellia bacterium]
DAGLIGVAAGSTVALDDGVRGAIDGVGDVASWQRVARVVSAAGVPWRGGLQIGAGESESCRLRHLIGLREHVKDGTMISIEVGTIDPRLGVRPEGASAHDLLRTVALARLVLPAGCAVSALWMHGAPSLAQAALTSGADVLSPVILPSRGIEADAHYTNPRAVAAQRRVTDAWKVTLDDVQRHLSGVGRESMRAASTTSTSGGVDATPRPGA